MNLNSLFWRKWRCLHGGACGFCGSKQEPCPGSMAPWKEGDGGLWGASLSGTRFSRHNKGCSWLRKARNVFLNPIRRPFRRVSERGDALVSRTALRKRNCDSRERFILLAKHQALRGRWVVSAKPGCGERGQGSADTKETPDTKETQTGAGCRYAGSGTARWGANKGIFTHDATAQETPVNRIAPDPAEARRLYYRRRRPFCTLGKVWRQGLFRFLAVLLSSGPSRSDDARPGFENRAAAAGENAAFGRRLCATLLFQER